MFDSLTDRMNGAFKSLIGQGKISESNIDEAVREVRVALLEADVNISIARSFVERIKIEAQGEKVLTAVDPGEMFVKIVHDAIVNLLGGEREDINFNPDGPTIIMLCGLQGAGKTTTCGKLASRFKGEGRKPLLVAADVQRPAAIEQLRVLGRQIDVQVHAQEGGDPVQICKQSLEIAKLNDLDTIILDTAGRLHVDDELMNELEKIAKATKPSEILFVCDAMIGQSAVDTAEEFNKRLSISGAVMTKMDSDARGGAALSLRELTGVCIKYVTVGEKLDAIEEFHPERMAGRILGMGDVVSLVEKAQSVVDEKEAEAMRSKLEKNKFTLEDFQKQLAQIKKMGSIKDLLGLLPGIGSKLKGLDIDESRFKKIEALIQSMTPEERQNPEVIGLPRMKRIAKGSGNFDVNGEPATRPVKELLKQFTQMKKMIGKMGKLGMFSSETYAGMEGVDADPESMLAAAERGENPGQLPSVPGMGSVFGKSKKQGAKAQQDKKKNRKKEKERRKKRKRR